ncbi:MAG: hypothetical protein ACQEP1_02120 [Nanobdellota archaeon]
MGIKDTLQQGADSVKQHMSEHGNTWIKLLIAAVIGGVAIYILFNPFFFPFIGLMIFLMLMQTEMVRESKGLKLFLILLFIGVPIYFFFNHFFYPFLIIGVLIELMRTKFVREYPLAQFVIIIGIVAAFVYFVAPILLSDTAIMSEGSIKSLSKEVAISSAETLTFWKDWDPAANWGNFTKKQLDYASGGYFTGRVEEGEKDERLGIYIEDIKASSPILKEGEEMTFWATVKGKTLDKEKEVRMICNSSDNATRTYPENGRYDSFSIFSYEEKSMDCVFDDLPEGTFKVNFFAEYDFSTLGYTKAYFIEEARLRALRKEGTDPLEEYDVKDRNPTAVYTSGPIKIGIGTVDYQPIPVSKNDERLARLGITLENGWEGHIKDINELEIQVPKSMKLKLERCDHEMEKVPLTESGCADRCEGDEGCIDECQRYFFYKLKEDIGEIKRYRTISCPLYSRKKTAIVGSAPLSTKYIRVIADYDYLTNAHKTFHVKGD